LGNSKSEFRNCGLKWKYESEFENCDLKGKLKIKKSGIEEEFTIFGTLRKEAIMMKRESRKECG
jgi:hypothetical protein